MIWFNERLIIYRVYRWFWSRSVKYFGNYCDCGAHLLEEGPCGKLNYCLKSTCLCLWKWQGNTPTPTVTHDGLLDWFQGANRISLSFIHLLQETRLTFHSWGTSAQSVNDSGQVSDCFPSSDNRFIWKRMQWEPREEPPPGKPERQKVKRGE